MMAARWRSPWTTVAQHAEAQLEPMDDDGGAGAGSRQNFGSVTAQGKKTPGLGLRGGARELK
jgi:hypothetical protein